MSFGKILIANRGDKRSVAERAAKGRVGEAEVSRSQIACDAMRPAIEPRS
jgi:hypothetical protein